jgi:hypothetical protein
MSNHLDLEEQEQLEQLKAFWGQYGNAITWGLILVFGAFAAWNGFQYWQRQPAAGLAMFDEVARLHVPDRKRNPVPCYECSACSLASSQDERPGR